jgi:lathosterol oxidase
MIIHILYFVICYDIWFYLSHIILHNKYIYKKIHQKHHITNYKTIKFKDAYVGHFLEGPIQSIGILFPFFIIENYDFVSFFFSVGVINIRSMLRHDNRFIWIIGNHHILHHKYPKYNFGEYWLDKLFRTNYPHSNEYEFGIIYI